MKRTTIGSALFAAPLIITGSLFAGGAAMADQSNTTALQLDARCTVKSTSQAYFELDNKNSFPVTVQYHNLDTGVTGTIQTVPNTNYYYAVPYDVNNVNNTTEFTADGWTSPNTTNANVSTECSAQDIAQFAPVVAAPVTTNLGTGSTGTTNTGSTDTGVVGGKGGDTSDDTAVVTPAATNTAASLADTGASQILPYTAAAILAVAVLGTTVAVRKNVL